MNYLVTFRKRFDREGEGSDNPIALVDPPDGVILDAAFVQRLEAPDLHVQEVADEDDDFLTFGTETWSYQIAEGREKEFEFALQNSEVVLEFEKVREEEVPAA
jgi:hypothetical protein